MSANTMVHVVLTDDDGSGTVGTILNNAKFDEIQSAVDTAITQVVQSKSANYTVVSTDDVIECTAALTLTLYNASTARKGRSLEVIATNGDVVLDANGSETIDGALTKTILSGSRWRGRITAANAWRTVTLSTTESPIILPQSFRGALFRTSDIYNDRQSKIQLQRVQHAVFNDGTPLSPAESSFPLTIDITATGANGRDQGSEEASTWYQIHLIRKATDGTLAGLLHKANRLILTEQLTLDATSNLRDAAARERWAQSISSLTAGTLRWVLFNLAKVGTPSGQIWLELQADSSGSPSGTALATSNKWLASDINATARGIPFLFLGSQAYSLAAATTYWLVLKGDWTISASNYVTIGRNSAGGYANGSIKSFDGAAWNAGTGDFGFMVVSETDDAAISLPSGYTQYCLLGFVYNDASSHFKPFRHINGWNFSLNTPVSSTFKLGVTDSSNIGNVLYDDGGQVPPIALALTLGMASVQAAAGTTVIFGSLDGGISITAGGSGDCRTHYLGIDGGGANTWTDVPYMWGGVQRYSAGANNGSFAPRGWRMP